MDEGYLECPVGEALTRLVEEIIAGVWGSGYTRIQRLHDAKFNDATIRDIQAEVNRRLR